MRFQWRPLRPGELDAELLWLCVTVASAGLGAVWLWLQLPTPQCTFRSVTGYPCVTCGATRGVMALMQGDVIGAWRLNPLVVVGLAAVAVFDLYALAVLLTRARRLRLSFTARGWKTSLAVAGAAILLNWLYLVGR